MSRATRHSLPALLAVLIPLAACNADAGEPAEAGDLPDGDASVEPRTGDEAPGEAPPPAAEAVTLPLTPENAKRVVGSLVEAFRAGDRERVESLWAADGGTWTDQAGFDERAGHYRDVDFDLDPASMQVVEHTRTIQVVVPARREDADWVWSFLVTEIDGELRAGGVETSLAGLP